MSFTYIELMKQVASLIFIGLLSVLIFWLSRVLRGIFEGVALPIVIWR